jgi:hypothetical protein
MLFVIIFRRCSLLLLYIVLEDFYHLGFIKVVEGLNFANKDFFAERYTMWLLVVNFNT